MLGNVEWFQEYPVVQFDIMDPSVSDHALLKVETHEQLQKIKGQFKFMNCTVESENFLHGWKRSGVSRWRAELCI